VLVGALTVEIAATPGQERTAAVMLSTSR